MLGKTQASFALLLFCMPIIIIVYKIDFDLTFGIYLPMPSTFMLLEGW